MAVKTITVDLEAYERLTQARLVPGESFSKVIKRAHWSESLQTGRVWARGLSDFPAIAPSMLDALEENQRLDKPPEDPWAS